MSASVLSGSALMASGERAHSLAWPKGAGLTPVGRIWKESQILYSNFTDEEDETQREDGIYLRSHSLEEAELRLNLELGRAVHGLPVWWYHV